MPPPLHPFICLLCLLSVHPTIFPWQGRELTLGASGWTLLAYAGSQSRLSAILMMGEGRKMGVMSTMLKESGKAEIKELYKESAEKAMARAENFANKARDVKARLKEATTREAMKEAAKGAFKKYLT